MKNESIRLNFNMDAKERIKVKVNGSVRGQGLCMQMRKRKWHHKRNVMQQGRFMFHLNDNNKEVRALDCWSVGHVVGITLTEIVHNIGLVDLLYTLHMRRKTLWMLVRMFHVSMPHWTRCTKKSKNL